MFAVFNTYEEAEEYNDEVQTLLLEEPLYIAERWAYVFPFEGKFYIDAHPDVPAETIVSEIPNLKNYAEQN